ncbi:hypothetical protein MUK42_37124 [Musa troglodytarum]|uniref:Uncharacterized protein n=1 Tax=Musa troglodytarum TaxID=320322 RepID=A0A9E7HST4_9LILI|nr:hypothetical protein MUK42_37124 [Musa troglodytarum]
MQRRSTNLIRIYKIITKFEGFNHFNFHPLLLPTVKKGGKIRSSTKLRPPKAYAGTQRHLCL